MSLLKTKIVISAMVLSTLMPFLSRDSLAARAQTSTQQSIKDMLLVKPYAQLGNNPRAKSKEENLEVLWFGKSADASSWKLRFRQNDNQSWKVAPITETNRINTLEKSSFFRFRSLLSGLTPGSRVDYELWANESKMASGSAIARKSKEQPYRFAVFGDIGAGSSGQRKVAYQCARQKPDFIMMPGDIAYDRGRISEYLSRFFPYVNSDKESMDSGAPLLSRSIALTAIGNHDIAYSSWFKGTDMSKYPDALGYFIFWSQPLNGPNKLVNAKNTPYMSGAPDRQLDFVKAAGSNYPVMANYSFEYANSFWLVLDVNPYMDWTNKKLRNWVDSTMRNSGNHDFRFVCLHQPGFSIDHAHWIEQRMRLLCDLFEKHKVDIVFAGHSHNYQRSKPLYFKPEISQSKNPGQAQVPGTFTLDEKFAVKKDNVPDGVIYIVSGAGGASLYKCNPALADADFIDKFVDNQHSFTIVDVDGGKLSLRQISADGNELDSFVIDKRNSSGKEVKDNGNE